MEWRREWRRRKTAAVPSPGGEVDVWTAFLIVGYLKVFRTGISPTVGSVTAVLRVLKDQVAFRARDGLVGRRCSRVHVALPALVEDRVTRVTQLLT